eukprot:TRINITY_DN5980_c0_g1_i11.p1 TRINITY_DN5980_c0_g1~~TRINITY_DN5980_c0_g1_i11.p1  ORF type:complete len:120 (-),score=10.09 TRINITY_DN5980_c0_g1_i11:384-743(-)
MLRSLVGSEMCIRDRYQRRVRGSFRRHGEDTDAVGLSKALELIPPESSAPTAANQRFWGRFPNTGHSRGDVDGGRTGEDQARLAARWVPGLIGAQHGSGHSSRQSPLPIYALNWLGSSA